MKIIEGGAGKPEGVENSFDLFVNVYKQRNPELDVERLWELRDVVCNRLVGVYKSVRFIGVGFGGSNPNIKVDWVNAGIGRGKSYRNQGLITFYLEAEKNKKEYTLNVLVYKNHKTGELTTEIEERLVV